MGGDENYSSQVNPASCLFLLIKFYWNVTPSIGLMYYL